MIGYGPSPSGPWTRIVDVVDNLEPSNRLEFAPFRARYELDCS
jgi:hypothetical protein